MNKFVNLQHHEKYIFFGLIYCVGLSVEIPATKIPATKIPAEKIPAKKSLPK